MSSYLLLENGSKIVLEDASGDILLDEVAAVVVPVISYTVVSPGRPRRQ